MSDERDPPIEEKEYITGMTVVDIGDHRVARGMTRRSFSGCNHHRQVYDQQERRIWCKDCERDVEPFDAFVSIVNQLSAATMKLDSRAKRLAEAEAFQARSLAVKELDKVWRKRRMVPACPHCNMGLFPEDFKNGVGVVLGREYAEALVRRKRDK